MSNTKKLIYEFFEKASFEECVELINLFTKNTCTNKEKWLLTPKEYIKWRNNLEPKLKEELKKYAPQAFDNKIIKKHKYIESNLTCDFYDTKEDISGNCIEERAFDLCFEEE